MAIRICPQCMTRLSPGKVAASSDDIECPGCRKHLEVSSGSRMAATILGLLAAALVWRLTRPTLAEDGTLSWVLPIVYAVFAFGIVSALFLMLTADLRIRPPEMSAEPMPASAATGHGGGHH